jgi:hypothetical protein
MKIQEVFANEKSNRKWVAGTTSDLWCANSIHFFILFFSVGETHTSFKTRKSQWEFRNFTKSTHTSLLLFFWAQNWVINVKKWAESESGVGFWKFVLAWTFFGLFAVLDFKGTTHPPPLPPACVILRTVGVRPIPQRSGSNFSVHLGGDFGVKSVFYDFELICGVIFFSSAL